MVSSTISHYNILEKLGQGGMGIVFKAHDMKLDRIVALKFLPQHVISREENRARFHQEAKVASQINHPNVCVIHAIEEVDDQQFIVMEYVDGVTLKEKIYSNNDGETRLIASLPFEDAINYSIQIAEALNEAHSKDIIHRDIKSENIMINSKNQIKVMDFGLAKLKDTLKLTKTTSTIGTVAYMAPEVIKGGEGDARSDIFSFGVVVYEILTGRLPFSGKHEAAMMYSILNEEPTLAREYRTDIPAELQMILARLLEKKPEVRYQTVHDALVDLYGVKGTSDNKKDSSKLDIQEQKGRDRESEQTKIPTKKKYVLPFIIALFAIVIGVGIYFIPTIRNAISQSEQKSNTQPASTHREYRIAVLPLKNFSDDKKDEYFADGMTDELNSSLGKVNELKVIGRTSVMEYKFHDARISEIGRKLNVNAVLEGSVRKDGKKVRIIVRLIDAITEEKIWEGNYDNKITDIFTIQSDVAERVASSLKIQLRADERTIIGKKRTANFDAYTLYLQGRDRWNRRTTPNDLWKSIEYFNRAIEKDPEYALAFAGLADSYILLGSYNLFSSKETYPKAKVAALKALELDSTLAEAHASLALATMYYDWDWKRAESEFKHAIDLNPNYSIALSYYAHYLALMNRSREAETMLQRAEELDPQSAAICADAALVSYFSHRYDEAIRLCMKALKMDPGFIAVYVPLSGAYLQKGLFQEAMANLEKASFYSGFHPIMTAAIAYVNAVSGKKDEAGKTLRQLKNFSAHQYVSTYWISIVYVGLQEYDQAFTYLEKAYHEHDGSLVFLKVEPLFDPLRNDPRFIELLKKIGFEK